MLSLLLLTLIFRSSFYQNLYELEVSLFLIAFLNRKSVYQQSGGHNLSLPMDFVNSQGDIVKYSGLCRGWIQRVKALMGEIIAEIAYYRRTQTFNKL